MLNQLVVPPADPIPEADEEAVRAWVSDLGAPSEILAMLGIDPSPEPVVTRRATLTPTQVREIRRIHTGGLTPRRISERFDVSLKTIQDVVSRRTWKTL